MRSKEQDYKNEQLVGSFVGCSGNVRRTDVNVLD